MTPKKKRAAELMAELEADPTFRAQQREREQLRLRDAGELARAEAPLLRALTEVGLDVKSVWDLVNRATRHYPEAVPVLIDHIQRPYPDTVRAGIARALTVAEARPRWDFFMELYRKERGRHAKEGLAVALSGIATDEVIGDVIALAKDQNNGPSRVLLLSSLESSKDPRAHQALVELGTDPELRKQVHIILRRKKRSNHRL